MLWHCIFIMLLGIFEASNEVQLQFCSKVICWQFKGCFVDSSWNKEYKVSAGYVWQFMSIICDARSWRSNHYIEANNYAHTHIHTHTHS